MAAGLIETYAASVRLDRNSRWRVVRAASKLNVYRPNQFATGEKSLREASHTRKREAYHRPPACQSSLITGA